MEIQRSDEAVSRQKGIQMLVTKHLMPEMIDPNFLRFQMNYTPPDLNPVYPAGKEALRLYIWRRTHEKDESTGIILHSVAEERHEYIRTPGTENWDKFPG